MSQVDVEETTTTTTKPTGSKGGKKRVRDPEDAGESAGGEKVATDPPADAVSAPRAKKKESAMAKLISTSRMVFALSHADLQLYSEKGGIYDLAKAVPQTELPVSDDAFGFLIETIRCAGMTKYPEKKQGKAEQQKWERLVEVHIHILGMHLDEPSHSVKDAFARVFGEWGHVGNFNALKEKVWSTYDQMCAEKATEDKPSAADDKEQDE